MQISQEAYAKEPSHMTYVSQIVPACFYFMFVRGNNTVEKAKEYGSIDARALYPDFKPLGIEEYAKLFYKELPDISYGWTVAIDSLYIIQPFKLPEQDILNKRP